MAVYNLSLNLLIIVNKVKRLLCFLVLLGAALAGIAQESYHPLWVDTPPTAGNDTYLYVTESAEGATQTEARNKALAYVYQTTMMRIGAVVSWDEINKSIQDGESWSTVSMKYNIPVNKVCEYVEKDRDVYYVIVLCQVAKAGNIVPEWEEYTKCNEISTSDRVAKWWKQHKKRSVGGMLMDKLRDKVSNN